MHLSFFFNFTLLCKAMKKCSITEFTCRNGVCISAELICNGEDDCHDCGSDKTCLPSDEATCPTNCADEDQVTRATSLICTIFKSAVVGSFTIRFRTSVS